MQRKEQMTKEDMQDYRWDGTNIIYDPQPEDYISLEQEEYHRRVDAVVEEMKALSISSIVIVQDSVTISMGRDSNERKSNESA